MLKKKLTYFMYAALIAYCYFWLTAFFFFNLTDRNVLISTVLNAAVIIAFVAMDKIEDYIYIKLKAKPETKKPSIPKKILIWYVSDKVSTFSALYLFYIVILICTAIIKAEPDFPFPPEMTDYLQSVYYGMLILIATDKFTQQLFKKDMLREYKELKR